MQISSVNPGNVLYGRRSLADKLPDGGHDGFGTFSARF